MYCYIEPIPLTAEWLIKLGFNEQGGDYIVLDKSSDERLGYVDERSWTSVKIKYWEFIATGDNHKGYLFQWHESEFHNYQKERVIRYVHELQNLYFALTGNELTIIK